jgi:hypothetical protein
VSDFALLVPCPFFLSFSVDAIPTVFNTLIEQGAISTPQFSFYLSATDGSQGELTLGGYDQSRFSGELTWVPLTSETYWETHLDALQLGGKQVTNATKVLSSKPAAAAKRSPLSASTVLCSHFSLSHFCFVALPRFQGGPRHRHLDPGRPDQGGG